MKMLNYPITPLININNYPPKPNSISLFNPQTTSKQPIFISKSNSSKWADVESVSYSTEMEDYLENTEMKKLQFKPVELEMEFKELEELPENWRRSKLAWLCKELPSHKYPTVTRLLSAHKKWLRQQDCSYLAVHCMRVRENQAAFLVYNWMMKQHWFRFDFALATKLADYIGRERKFAKCREIFDDIIRQGRVPSESTFHILIVAYLSAPEDCLDQACEIYSQMIHLGAYRPRLSLHNALFRAIINKPAKSAKQYLKQAEFIFHNLVTCRLEVHKDIYGGLLWLHSFQDPIDKDRMISLRKEMHQQGFSESRDTLLTILRACAKEGDLVEAEATWLKLLQCEGKLPSQAYVYKMQVHAKVKDFEKSLNIFREMQEQLEDQVTVVAYHKIIEIMCNAQEVELAESLMDELIKSGQKPLLPSFLDQLNMYFKLSLHDKVESTFLECLQRCRPNRTVYSIYLESLVQSGDIGRAESLFGQMVDNDAVGVSSRSCNILLNGYLLCREHVKAEKMFRFMNEQGYKVEPLLMEKLESVFRHSKKVIIQRSEILKLTPAQREILVGLLLGGLQVEYAEDKKKHFVCFEFKENNGVHSVLKRHVYNKYSEWLQPSNSSTVDVDNIPSKFLTVPHALFGFYADQFWSNGRRSIPKLIHRWLSPCTLAYWFMYSGYRTPTGNILLKLKGNRGDVERVFKALKSKSLEFRVKQKGMVFWVGFMESDSTCFWRLIEPYILDDIRDILDADNPNSENGVVETSSMLFRSEFNSDYEPDKSSEFSDNDGS